MDQVEEIKNKLDIIAVIGEYVSLRKAGVNWKGRCPFHNEKSPSFLVNPEKNIWHCFGCSKGGDIFSFVQEMEHLEFPETLKLLADKAGVKLENHDPRLSSQKNRLQNICQLATKHWQRNLQSPAGKNALVYLQARGIKEQTLQDFNFGYASNSWDELYNFLRAEKFTETEIFLAGLTVKKEKGGYYDRFRDRIIFPIADMHGNIVGFTARAMKKEELAKYINTPEGPIYHKGQILYGLDKAKNHIRQSGYVVVVEGNMDVVACHQFGYKNVVACSGTALTVEQIKILKRYSENIALCFDEDNAGQTAAERTLDLLIAEEMNIKVIKLLCGKDPDECLKTDPKKWEESLRQSKLVMQFYFDRYFTEEALKDISKKKKAAALVLLQVNKLKNKIEREHWLKKMAVVLDVSESILRSSFTSVSRPNFKGQNSIKPESKPLKSNFEESSESVISILLNRPELLSYAIQNLEPLMLSGEVLTRFYKYLVLGYNELGNSFSSEAARAQLFRYERSLADEAYWNSLILYIDKKYEGFSLDLIQDELIALIRMLKKEYFQIRSRELQKAMRQVSASNDMNEWRRLSVEKQICDEKIAELKQE